MKSTAILTIGLLALGTIGASAADLPQAPAAIPAMAPASPEVYVQLLAGPTAPLDVTFFDPIPAPGASFADKTKVGYAAAGTIGVVVAPGLSVEADAMYTNRAYDPTGSISSLSAMGNLKYTADISDNIAVYAAAGLGYIWYNDQFAAFPAAQAAGFGYQLIGGVAMKVADQISLLGEARFQDTFSPVALPDTSTIQVPTATFLVGLKFGM